jgi:hypothetical protein
VAAGDRPYYFSWSPWVATTNEQRLLLQLQYTDRIVGQIMDGLRDEGIYDDAVIVVAADHGISLESRTTTRDVEPSTIDTIAYVPLLIKAPGQQNGAIDDANVMAVDVVPTLADLLDLDLSWDVDGSPIGSPAIAERGDEKVIYDMVLNGDQADRVDFHDAEAFPRAAERWIGPLPDPGDPLSGLWELLRLDGVLGRDLDDVLTGAGGEAILDDLPGLAQPPPGEPRYGLMSGRVPDAPPGARVVLALDGTVVGGSELSTDAAGTSGRFVVLIPQGALRDRNDVRAALVTPGAVTELTLR